LKISLRVFLVLNFASNNIAFPVFQNRNNINEGDSGMHLWKLLFNFTQMQLKGLQIRKFEKIALGVAVLAVISLLLIFTSLIQPKIALASDIVPLAKKTSPTPSPTPTPTRTPTPTPTVRPSPSPTPTPTPTAKPSYSPTPTPNPSPTVIPTPTPTFTPTPTATSTPTPTFTSTPTPTQTPTSSPTSTSTPTPSPTPTQIQPPIPTDSTIPTPAETSTPTQIRTPNPTTTFSPTLSPTPSPKPTFNSTTLQVAFSNGSIIDIGVNGITALSVTNAVISPDQFAAKTTLSLMIIGQKTTDNLNTFTIPKTAVTYGVTPKIYVNNQMALDQGFSQDADNYYVWYKSVFSNYELLIVFASQDSPAGISLWVILSVFAIILSISIGAVFLNKRRKSCEENIENFEDY
jgi:hypothetical protein